MLDDCACVIWFDMTIPPSWREKVMTFNYYTPWTLSWSLTFLWIFCGSISRLFAKPTEKIGIMFPANIPQAFPLFLGLGATRGLSCPPTVRRPNCFFTFTRQNNRRQRELLELFQNLGALNREKFKPNEKLHSLQECHVWRKVWAH